MGIRTMFRSLLSPFRSTATQDDDTTSTSGGSLPVPAQPQPQAPEQGNVMIVTGRFIEEGGQGQAEANRQTERFRQLVSSFDEDKQEALEWMIRKAATVFCYIAPFSLAVPIGFAVGDTFTPAGASTMMAIAIHMLSVMLEIVLPVLGLATSISAKRAMKDKAKWGGAIAVGLFFLTVSVGNAMALFYLLERGGITVNDPAAAVAVLVRSFGALILDTACTVYLIVAGARSLQKFLADQQQKIAAIKQVSDIEIQIEQSLSAAERDRQEAEMDMKAKKERQQTWNEIERIQSQSMIEQARQRMLSDGSGRSRYGGW
jgi:hypothetical protein